jgi:hypothetical protein
MVGEMGFAEAFEMILIDVGGLLFLFDCWG